MFVDVDNRAQTLTPIRLGQTSDEDRKRREAFVQNLVHDHPSLVPMAEIELNGYNLNISRYVSTTTSAETIDLQAVHQTLMDIEEKAAAAAKRHNQFLQELGLPLT